MHALVTGGAGFIGSFLVTRLLQEGYTVTIFDRYSAQKKQILAAYVDNPSCTIIWGDVSKKDHVKPHYFKDVDWVFHLAGKGNVAPSLADPLMFHQVHVDGTIHVLEAARRARVRRFIYAGSASCYGAVEKPTPETAPIQIDHPYALTKYMGEQYALHWGKVYALPVVSLRLFNSYGPRLRTARTFGPVFSAFLAQKLAGMPYTVVGNGTQTRDFVFVTDVVDAFFRAARSSASGEVFNVGSGHPHSINELVALLGGEVTYIPKRPGEPEVTHADISKIQTQLGWEPKVSFAAGVKRVLANITHWKHAPVWTPERIQEETQVWFEYLGKHGGRMT